MTKVSVIIPVYKVPLEYLRECFESLLAQTMQDCEFIMVSDGAPDAECSICEEYAAKDPRFKFFHREHAGVSATRNFGIEQAHGEYITFVDSDDWIEPTTCEDLHHFAKSNHSDVVLFDLTPVGFSYTESSYSHKSKSKLDEEDISQLLKQIILLQEKRYIAAVSTCCKFTKRSLFLEGKIQFPEHIFTSEDRPVSYAIFKNAKHISYLKRAFYKYNNNTLSVTKKFLKEYLKQSTAYLYNIKEFDNLYKDIIGLAAINLYFASWENCYLNKENRSSIISKYHDLKLEAQSKKFQRLIQDATLNDFPFIIKQEAILLKHKITFPFLFHAIKNFFNR